MPEKMEDESMCGTLTEGRGTKWEAKKVVLGDYYQKAVSRKRMRQDETQKRISDGEKRDRGMM